MKCKHKSKHIKHDMNTMTCICLNCDKLLGWESLKPIRRAFENKFFPTATIPKYKTKEADG